MDRVPAPGELASDTGSERSEPASSSSHHSPGGSSPSSASSGPSSASSGTSSGEGEAGTNSPVTPGSDLALAAEDNPQRAEYYLKRKDWAVHLYTDVTVRQVNLLSDTWSGGVLFVPILW